MDENGVGKTSLINRCINDEFDSNKENETLGASFSVKEIKKYNNVYTLKIWDNIGQEKYHSLTKLFIKGLNTIKLVYSIDSRESFNN